MGTPQVDKYIWGEEVILWGYDLSHKYTLKILKPKMGAAGCLSLQYHNEKSESWAVFKGKAWALVVVDGVVCTKILEPGFVMNLPAGVIHRIAGLTQDIQVYETSTPDRHAADKTAQKDVIRLHCLHGREVTPANKNNEAILNQSITITLEAMEAIKRGSMPPEYNVEKLDQILYRNTFNQ